MLRNIAIDAQTGGFVLAGGELQFVSDNDSIVQAVRVRFKTFLGEYFLDDPADPQVGVPYLQQVLVKGPELRALDATFRKVLLGVAGVASVVSMDFSYDKPNRTLTVHWQATMDTGLLVADSQTVRA